MCGIVAVLNRVAREPHMRIGAAVRMLAHRGPDDEGVWTDGSGVSLANRRLSIIGPGSQGHQPMIDEATGNVVTFNGEIYNFVELRRELQAEGLVFRTATDTEVILKAYVAWGTECVTRFNGMWAFVLWDATQQVAFISRDRLGVKPLCYAFENGGLMLASEPKALLAIRPDYRVADDVALYLLLAQGSLYNTDRTFYQKIKSFPAGRLAAFQPGSQGLLPRRYWNVPVGQAARMTYAEGLEAFAALFRDAVALRLRSDVAVGFTLSGGLDSSSIVATAVHSRGNTDGLKAFTSTYDRTGKGWQDDERKWARKVAHLVGDLDLEEVDAPTEGWLPTLELIVRQMDGPGSSPAVYPLWRLMERARLTNVPVLLDGQGADELLGGYAHYATLALREHGMAAIRAKDVRRGIETFVDAARYRQTFGARSLVANIIRELAPTLHAPYRRRLGALGTLRHDFVRSMAPELDDAHLSELGNRLYADLTADILPALLQYGDAVSMAHGVETRFPFLDYRLVEFCTTLPTTFLIAHGRSKRILRDYLQVAGLPQIAARLDKAGYPTPVAEWLKHRGVLEATILSPEAQIARYVDHDALRRLIARLRFGTRSVPNHLYRLVTTELWLRTLHN